MSVAHVPPPPPEAKQEALMFKVMRLNRPSFYAPPSSTAVVSCRPTTPYAMNRIAAALPSWQSIHRGQALHVPFP